MITSIRSRKKLVIFSLWFIIIAFVGTIFFVWGMGDRVQEQRSMFTINGEEITDTEFRNALNNTREQFRSTLGDAFNTAIQPGQLENLVRDSLISKTLLLQEAEKLNVPVSDAEVLAYIQQIPAFQRDGQFDRDLYRNILARNRMTATDFEAGLKEDILYEKMQNIISNSVLVTDEEVARQFIYDNTEARISFIELNSDNFESEVVVNEEELQQFYEKNKSAYEVPAKIKVKYAVFDPERFQADIEISEEEAEQYFIKNKDQFNQQEQVKASHILIRVTDWNDEDAVNAARAEASEALAKVNSGANFADIAKQYSDDTSAQNGGDLGFFSKGQMVPEFEEAAFALDEGEVSDIIKTDFGFHIIKVYQHIDAKEYTFEEAKDIIIDRMKQEREQSMFRSFVLDIYRDIIKASNITAYNAQQPDDKKLATQQLDYFSRNNTPNLFLTNQQAANNLFGLNEKEVSRIHSINGKQYIFEISDKKEAYVPELSEVRVQVEKDFIRAESLKIAVAKAESATDAANLNKAADMLGKSFSTTPAFSWQEPIPNVGFNPELSEEIFGSAENTFIQKPFTQQGKVLLVQVKEIIKPDAAEMTAEERQRITQSLSQTKQQAAVSSYVDTLEANSEIEMNPRYNNLFEQAE